MNLDVAITTIGRHIARDCDGCAECDAALTTLQSNLNGPALRAARAALAGRPVAPTTVATPKAAAVALEDDSVPEPPKLIDLVLASRRN